MPVEWCIFTVLDRTHWPVAASPCMCGRLPSHAWHGLPACLLLRCPRAARTRLHLALLLEACPRNLSDLPTCPPPCLPCAWPHPTSTGEPSAVESLPSASKLEVAAPDCVIWALTCRPQLRYLSTDLLTIKAC